MYKTPKKDIRVPDRGLKEVASASVWHLKQDIVQIFESEGCN